MTPHIMETVPAGEAAGQCPVYADGRVQVSFPAGSPSPCVRHPGQQRTSHRAVGAAGCGHPRAGRAEPPISPEDPQGAGRPPLPQTGAGRAAAAWGSPVTDRGQLRGSPESLLAGPRATCCLSPRLPNELALQVQGPPHLPQLRENTTRLKFHY